jgi:hypothetical protein
VRTFLVPDWYCEEFQEALEGFFVGLTILGSGGAGLEAGVRKAALGTLTRGKGKRTV